jgi:hypothetical protein
MTLPRMAMGMVRLGREAAKARGRAGALRSSRR